MGQIEPVVFVVDNDLAVRQSIAALVRASGFRFEGHSSGEEFLAAFDPNRMGCVVLDMRLEGMSGLELLARLEEMGSLLPVVVLSGYVDVAQAVEAMHRGARTVLEKPCAPGRLMQEVQEAIQWDLRTRPVRRRCQTLRRRIRELEPRQRRVLALVLEDWPNRVIARELGVSQRTVDRLRAGVYAKLGVQSAVEAARLLGPWVEELEPLAELPLPHGLAEEARGVCPPIMPPHWPAAAGRTAEAGPC